MYSSTLFNLGARWVWMVNTTPGPFYHWDRPNTICIRGWLDPRVGLDGCGESHRPLGFDPQTVHPIASHCTNYFIPKD